MNLKDEVKREGGRGISARGRAGQRNRGEGISVLWEAVEVGQLGEKWEH